MPLTPFLVARSQLLTAIDLFFEDRDPVSVQALAGNARELLERLCRLRGIERAFMLEVKTVDGLFEGGNAPLAHSVHGQKCAMLSV
jgi:hypothetical protein